MYRRFYSLWLRLLQTGFILWVGFWGSSVQCAFSQEPVDISPILDQVVQLHKLPAMAGGIILDGKLYATGVAGVRKAGTEIKALVTDSFHIGSCTKSMTSTLVGMLIEEGKLRWDSTLTELFPEFLDVMNPVFKDVTVEHLMQMSSGLYRNVNDDKNPGDTPLELSGVTAREQRHACVGMILQSKEEYQPGERYSYSNAGYIVLGAMIEKLTGQDWENVLRERVFEPLGMTSAGTGTYGSDIQIDAPWWHSIDEQGQRIAVAPRLENDLPSIYAPAGLVHCTIADWAKFLQIHLLGEMEDQVLLKRETILRLHTPAFLDKSYASGFGAMTIPEFGGGVFLTHNGSNLKNFSTFMLSPTRRFAAFAIINQAGEDAENGMEKAIVALMQKFMPTSHIANWRDY